MVYVPITPLPDAPVRGDAPATFATKANAHVAALSTWTTQVNAAGLHFDGVDTSTAASAAAALVSETNAAASEDVAVGASNYKGEWSTLTGALAIPASVSHTGVVWLLKENIADVTLSQPSLVNTDWIALTQPVQTGSLALTSEFELELDSANVGDMVGLYSNGKVRVIKTRSGETNFAAAGVTFVNVLALTATKSIAVYKNSTTSIACQMLNVAGTKITTDGAAQNAIVSNCTYIHAEQIDASKILIVYQDTSDSSQGKAVVVTITGSTISVGTPVVFNAAVTTYCRCALLSATKAVVVYRDEGNSNYGVATTLAIAGNVLTAGTEVNFKAAAVLYLDVCALGATSAIVSYQGTSSYPEAAALTINPGIVVGTPFTLKSEALSSTSTAISTLTGTTAVVSYACGSILYSRFLTNSSGTITAGTELNLNDDVSELMSIPLTATKVALVAWNVETSSTADYYIITNTSGTSLAKSSSATFNAAPTTNISLSKISDTRFITAYRDQGDSNKGNSYLIDIGTGTLQKIAGIAKEAGVEGNVIDVVTTGECDFLSGLVAGSFYYSSATGALSATVGDYEVGVAKSATNFVLNADIPKVDEEKIAFIERLIAGNRTPSIDQAFTYDFWKTREVKTSSGTFTVPSNVYAVGIFCLGAGANGTSSVGGGGGGLSMKIKAVEPGESVSYTISAGIASCDGMTANPASTSTGGSASGGTYNFSGGSVAANRGATGGCGGNNTLGSASGFDCGGGSMGHWGQISFWSHTGYSFQPSGGLGMWATFDVMKVPDTTGALFGGGGFGCCATHAYVATDSTGALSGGLGRAPVQLGIFVTTDITGNNSIGKFSDIGVNNYGYQAGDWNGGGVSSSGNYSQSGGIGGGGAAGNGNSGINGASGGFGGGGGGSAAGVGGAGGFGAGGGYGGSSYAGGAGGYGGGGGKGGAAGGLGGSSVVIFVF